MINKINKRGLFCLILYHSLTTAVVLKFDVIKGAVKDTLRIEASGKYK